MMIHLLQKYFHPLLLIYCKIKHSFLLNFCLSHHFRFQYNRHAKSEFRRRGGDMNVILSLESNIEKKTTEKNKLMVEKITKIVSNTFKMTKEIQNIKNIQDLNKPQIEANKKLIEDLNLKHEILNKVVEINNEDIIDKLEFKIAYLEIYRNLQKL